ncbi:MAG: hypothetical protein U9Q16_01020 [Patescibacteria group bacterium]|nr:hypothetical protein [Patescibacteria group bacterium]
MFSDNFRRRLSMVFALAKLVAENVDSQTSQGFELSVAENIGCHT